MSSREKNRPWSVFDAVEVIPAALPEALMSETNAAIIALEYARATALLHPDSSSPSNDTPSTARHPYDVRMAGEAYRAGCLALASQKLDEALHFLNISLSNCPPHRASAVNKLQSLISLTSQQLQRGLSPS